MTQPVYYRSSPVGVPQVEQGLKTFIDTFISEFLQTSTPSLTLRVFLQSFGPVGAANFIEQEIVRDGDFVLINGIRYLIETTGEAAIAKILFDATMPRVAAAIALRLSQMPTNLGFTGDWTNRCASRLQPTCRGSRSLSSGRPKAGPVGSHLRVTGRMRARLSIRTLTRHARPPLIL
jgi:hypothetical protein